MNYADYSGLQYVENHMVFMKNNSGLKAKRDKK